MQNFAACNNIFYIKDGYVQQYTAIGTGGVRCYTNEALRPGFRGSTRLHKFSIVRARADCTAGHERADAGGRGRSRRRLPADGYATRSASCWGLPRGVHPRQGTHLLVVNSLTNTRTRLHWHRLTSERPASSAASSRRISATHSRSSARSRLTRRVIATGRGKLQVQPCPQCR
jgi:hypothetical protein